MFEYYFLEGLTSMQPHIRVEIISSSFLSWMRASPFAQAKLTSNDYSIWEIKQVFLTSHTWIIPLVVSTFMSSSTDKLQRTKTINVSFEWWEYSIHENLHRISGKWIYFNYYYRVQVSLEMYLKTWKISHLEETFNSCFVWSELNSLYFIIKVTILRQILFICTHFLIEIDFYSVYLLKFYIKMMLEMLNDDLNDHKSWCDVHWH